MKEETKYMELSEMITNIHEAMEGRYSLTGEDLHTMHAQLCSQQPKQKEWISVKDRLPENGEKGNPKDDHIYCLVVDKTMGVVVRPYSQYHNCWDLEDGDDYYCDAVDGKITHWMTLPCPPTSK